ncbi:hypothetical protein HDU99_004766, partial [Rhizoclosmatium hyalinum]
MDRYKAQASKAIQKFFFTTLSKSSFTSYVTPFEDTKGGIEVFTKLRYERAPVKNCVEECFLFMK